MKMIVGSLAVCLVAVAAAGNPAKVALRAGGVSLATDASLKQPAAVAADKLLHLLAGDEKKDTKAEKKANGVTVYKDAKDEKEGKEAGNEKEEKKNKTEASAKGDAEVSEQVEVSLEEFLPSCLVHTAEIVQEIDESYTDEQIKMVLQNECFLSKQFPTVHDNGFKSHAACMTFAESLSVARHEELADGSTDGYKTFCEDFYSHSGFVPAGLKKDAPAAGPGFQWVWRAWVLGIALSLFLIGILGCIFMKKKEPSNNLSEGR